MTALTSSCGYQQEKGIEGPAETAVGNVLRLELTPKNVMQFLWIPRGTYLMGRAGSRHAAQHRVTLTKGFWMQETEVTQGQWEGVMGSNPSLFKGDLDRPVERVNWFDCHEFLKRLNERWAGQLGQLRGDLPTEAEWEYACRAGSASKYCFGDDRDQLVDYAWYSENSGDTTHPVGRKRPNAWGLYDMHGNVWEWCRDWYGEYVGDAVDPRGPERGDLKVMRGGSWTHEGHSAERETYEPADRMTYLGFRVVLRKAS